MPPEFIDADPTSLPLSFRGYDCQATEELFRRVAWEYGLLVGEHRKLKNEMQGLLARSDAPPAGAAPRQATGDLDEVARSLLTAAHKAARDMRESAREDSERALKKARARAEEIGREAERDGAATAAVSEAAAALRATLQAALARLEAETPGSRLAASTESPQPTEVVTAAAKRLVKRVRS